MQSLIPFNYSAQYQTDSLYESNLFTRCFSPRWKQRKLWVKACKELKVIYFPTEDDKRWLAGYLARSPIEAVCLNAELGEVSLTVWADACRIARKPAFLRLPATRRALPSRKGLKRRLHQMVDWVVAMTILLIFSPLILGLMLFIRSKRNQPTLIREWCVGDRGRIFQLLSLNIQLPWKLKHLPNLVNVLRGDTNLRQENHCPLRSLL